jgi:hypothetical protein
MGKEDDIWKAEEDVRRHARKRKRTGHASAADL